MANNEKDIDQASDRSNIHPDFIEMPDFVPIRIELIQLLKYWYKQYLFWRLWYYTTGGSENKELGHCARRKDRIVALLQNEETEKAVQEAREEFKNDHGSCFDEHGWNVFFHGSKEQKDALWDKFAEGRLYWQTGDRE